MRQAGVAEYATGPLAHIAGHAHDQRFFAITIAMYFDDHGHPTATQATRTAAPKVRIDQVEVIDSDLGQRQMRLVLAWAELHQAELLENCAWHVPVRH